MFWKRNKPTNPLAFETAATSGAASASDFAMPIEDVFSITGRGTVTTGTIERGTASKGDQLQVVLLDGTAHSAKCVGIESFRKQHAAATVGDKVGIVLTGIKRENIPSGSTLRGM